MLTRKELEAAINQGGSVLVHGKVYDSVDALPPEHVLAAGDAQRAKGALEALDQQIATLQAQRAALVRTAEEADAKQKEATAKKAEKPPDEGKGEGDEPPDEGKGTKKVQLGPKAVK